MAFYSSSVDEAGNEIHRTSSAREFTDRMLSTRSNRRSARIINATVTTNYRTVSRYVNPAAFVEKSPDIDVEETESSDSKQMTTEISSDIVPRLYLNSEDNSPSPDDLSYSYRKVCEVPKIIEKADAYAHWLSAKRKMKSYEAAKKKKAEAERAQQIAEKRSIAKDKYQAWLAAKSEANEKLNPKKKNKNRQTEDKPAPQPLLTIEEAESNRRAWEEKKLEDEKRRREQIEYQRRKKHEQQEQRKKQAEESWEKWISEAGSRPKPVPLNRGIFSLKGTISDLYVNPNQWQNPNVDYN